MRRLSKFRLITLTLLSVGCGRHDESHFDGLTFSPDGTYIFGAYSRPSSSAPSLIYRIAVDTGKATRFTNVTKGSEGVPSFSRDGKRIAYSYAEDHGSRSRIIIANADGSGSQPWATSEGNDFRPLFASDDKSLIFARSGYYGSYSPVAQPHHHEWNFYVSDLDGGNKRQLTDEDFYMVSRASVSPDGKSMLFVNRTSPQGDVIAIYSLEQPPKPKRFLKPHVRDEPSAGPIIADAMFLPDGKSVLFLAASNGATSFDYDVYRTNPGTPDVDKLTSRNGYSYNLQVTRDGATAVFARKLGDQSQLFLLDLATRELRPLRVFGLE